MSGAWWQARLDGLQAAGRLPSVVAGVLQGGRPVWVGTAGTAVDPRTQYRIGSITKTLVAVLALQLRDEDELSLGDPLGRWLPGTGHAEVTIEQVLSHTGGLPSEPVGPWWERHPGVDVETLLTVNDGSGAVGPPGSWFHYSNLGFALLGEVVARAHGAPWWSVVSERLLAPLGMTRTTYAPVAPHAQGHSVVHLTGQLADEPHHDTVAMAPAGQAWSTVGDLARWAAFLAAGHPDVLGRETLLEMATADLAPSYGLGLRRVETGGTTLVGHTGSMPGFLASLFVDQASGDGAVLLTDATTGLVSDEVAPVLLGHAPVLAAPVTPWVPTVRVPDAVAPLLGSWSWGNTAVELRWSCETLQLWNVATGRLGDVFELRDDRSGPRLVGVEGYHRGETLHVHPDHLECATFVYTRTPYALG